MVNNDENKYIGAICASPAIVLSKAKIEEGKLITSYPGKGFEDLLKKADYSESRDLRNDPLKRKFR